MALFPTMADDDVARMRQSCDLVDPNERELLNRAADLDVDLASYSGAGATPQFVAAMLAKLRDDEMAAAEQLEIFEGLKGRKIQVDKENAATKEKGEKYDGDAKGIRAQLDAKELEHRGWLTAERNGRNGVAKQTLAVTRAQEKKAGQLKKEEMEHVRLQKATKHR
jgi:hypothetical protein